MFTPYHHGLFFTADHVAYARQNAAREPFSSALAALKKPTLDWPSFLQIKCLRYLFVDDHLAGQEALLALQRDFTPNWPENISLLRAFAETVISAQIFEMVREHPANSMGLRSQFLTSFQQRIAHLNDPMLTTTYVESLWRALMNTAAGILLEDETLFDLGVQVFRRAIEHEISPRGFIDSAVAGADGGSMDRTIYVVTALVLIAEAASHVGVNLWDYHVRGVSVMTAAMYPIYYFYVTDKWQWDELTPEQVQDTFKRHGGYLEIVNRRAQPRDFKPLLSDMRPIYDPWAGGVTTLTHGVTARRGLFG